MGGVSSQRPSPTTDFCSWHSYFMKASQRLSKNVLIFIFLLVLVTYIFIENRYKCFKKEKSSHQSDLSLMCLKWLMTVTWSEANILHLVINQVKIYKFKKKKRQKKEFISETCFYICGNIWVNISLVFLKSIEKFVDEIPPVWQALIQLLIFVKTWFRSAKTEIVMPTLLWSMSKINKKVLCFF